MSMKGKKLLATGGSNFADEIKEFTDSNGILLATTGTTHNRLMEIADEVYDVNTIDADALEKLARRIHADGIFAGGNEPNIVTAIKVSDRIGLPYYCTLEQWGALMNKDSFKNLCKKFGLPVTPEVVVHTTNEVDTLDIPFPVVVKPTDSCGSKGVVFCANKEELKSGIKEALGFSASSNFIVEQYVTGEEISATYTICNGNITLSCMKEKYPVAEQSGLMNMPNVFIYPSKHLDRYLSEVNDNAIAMLKSLDLRFGTLFIQGFVNDTGIYIFEAGYRPGGTNDFRYTDRMNGVNQMHMLIEQAVTGRVEDDPNARDNPRFPKICCSFTMCARGGIVGKISGLDKVTQIKQVESIEQFYHEGDSIPFGKTLAQRMLRFFIFADDINETAEIINYIQDVVTVCDDSGKSILYSRFDTNRLY